MNLFRTFLLLQGYKLNDAKAELDKIYKLDHAAFLEWQNIKCKEIVAYHYANNPFYRKFIGNKLPDNWNDIPAITKSDYQKHPLAELVAAEYKLKDVYVSNTSGSTGNPFFFAKDKFAHAMTWEIIFKYYASFGIKNNDLQARFYGIPLSGKSMYIEKTKDLLMNRVRFPVFDLSDDKLEIYLNRFKKHKFVYIYGYTNSIRHFADYLRRKSILLKDICPTLKAVIVTSEMCTPNDRQLINTATGVPVHIEYGASETGIISFSSLNGGELKVCEESIYLETNEQNEILITNFYNKAFPVIRYKVGDMGTITSNENGSFITSLMGRSDDLVQLPNGRSAAGLTFYYCSRAILEKTTNIKELYITQKTISRFLINYISDTELTDNDKSIIQTNIDKMLQPGLELVFERTDIIRRKKNGKFQLFTSEINK